MYTVVNGREQHEFEKRAEAIRAAKRFSSNRRRSPVEIVRGAGNERMVYRNGRLEEAVYHTRNRRR